MITFEKLQLVKVMITQLGVYGIISIWKILLLNCNIFKQTTKTR